METFYDCIPCFIKQTLDVSRMSSPENEKLHGEILKQAMQEILNLEMSTPPPVVASRLHRIIKKMTGNYDPYKVVKDRFNNEALDLYDDLKRLIEDSARPFETAVKIAIAGNIIDFGHMPTTQDFDLKKSVKEVLEQNPVINHIDYLKENIDKAKKILYIADNTGEIVFDRVFIEYIMPKKIIYAVRKYPIINDANYEDAEYVGLTDIVKVIDNGTDVPGTYLQECSLEFKKEFDSADLIISKGQGNYETLGDEDYNIVFLLRAKCLCVSRDIGCKLNDIVVISKKYVKAAV
ncbi:MAG: ARMT1-like domain-containing protein [Cyanobacteriota bacterium]